MKRFIITSVCTLVFSLTGVIGAYQNSSNSDQLYNAKNNTTNVVLNVTDKDEQQTLESENQTKVTTEVTKATNIDKLTLNTNSTVSTEVTKPATGVLSATAYNTSNTLKIVYKNVDLSNCKSVKDVVSTLKKNGYTKVTRKNIYKNKSLKRILAVIKANNAAKATTTTTKPVTTPTPTKAPTPTKTPTTTTKSTTTPSTSTTKSGINSYASEVLRLVNVERAKAGLSALTTNTTLTSAANKRAQETVQSFSHTRPNGSGFSTVLGEYGISYSAAGENIAYGQKTPQEVVTAWMNSPGHRANILNAKFHKIGIGVHQSNGVIYWSQLFTN